jgi:hypothetical protein
LRVSDGRRLRLGSGLHIGELREALRLRPHWPEAANALGSILTTTTESNLRNPQDIPPRSDEHR